MTNLSRFSHKVEVARLQLSERRRQRDREPFRNPILDYDLALLATYDADAFKDETERALAWRRRIAAAVLVLLSSGLAIFALFFGAGPPPPSVPPFP